MTRAFIFPGQGSQSVGMGISLWESFSEAKEVFEEIDESLGQNLRKIMFEGPDDSLNLTENAQPALMAVSMAVARVLEKQGGIRLHEKCAFMAGHSLGEYSALTAAGSLTISQAARLLKIRGKAMQNAVPVGVGAMAAILGLSLEDVLAVVQSIQKEIGDEVCQIANDNSVGQVVISGHKGAVEKAIAAATSKGAKRAVLLPVSAPFHCALMQPAEEAMADAFANIEFKKPFVPVVSNVSAEGETNISGIRVFLIRQITGMVRWRESVLWMKERGVSEMVEIGAGKVLNGLVKRIDKDIACESVGTPEQIEELIKKLA